MSKNQIKPEASQPVKIPIKSSSIETLEQDEDVVIGSIGSAEKMAWSKNFLKQFSANAHEQETELIGGHEEVDDS